MTKKALRKKQRRKRNKLEAPNGIVWEDIDNFIKRYEEEHKK